MNVDWDFFGWVAFIAVLVALTTCEDTAKRDCRVKLVAAEKSASDAEAVCK